MPIAGIVKVIAIAAASGGPGGQHRGRTCRAAYVACDQVTVNDAVETGCGGAGGYLVAEAGSTVGAAAGAYAGLKLGGTAGSLAGPVGILVGGEAGAFVGAA